METRLHSPRGGGGERRQICATNESGMHRRIHRPLHHRMHSPSGHGVKELPPSAPAPLHRRRCILLHTLAECRAGRADGAEGGARPVGARDSDP